VPPKPKGTKGGKKNTHTNRDEEIAGNKKEEEGTSGRGSKTNDAAKPKTRRRDDDEEYNADVPVAAKAPLKKKTTTKKPAKAPKQQVKPTPVSPPQSVISGFTFTNDGGIMTNIGVGNVYNSTISGVGNDHSINEYHESRKRA